MCCISELVSTPISPTTPAATGIVRNARAPISPIGYYNKPVIYMLLFEVAVETLRTIAADLKHSGAQTGVSPVLHTWGSAMPHHSHVHGFVPGSGLSVAVFGGRKVFGHKQTEALDVGGKLAASIEHGTVNQPVQRVRQLPEQVAFRVQAQAFGGQHQRDQLLVGQLRCSDLALEIVAAFQFV
jgi:Putative transposase